VNKNILAPTTGALQLFPKKQNGSFLENSFTDFDYISVIYGDHVHK
jgi:hypothetical protein